jgi:hypothetical protein
MEAQLAQNNGGQTVIGGDQIEIGNVQESKGIAIGQGATAVHVDALGDVGDVITGTKISLVNRAAAPRRASKHQVSPPPADYIQRPEAEEALRKLLIAEHDDFHTVYFYGLPGVGKSWLARKVTTALGDTFVDGILGADLKTTDIRTAVWNFIEPYDETISRSSLTSASEFTAAMQTAFADQRILIVLEHLDEWGDNWQELRQWLPDQCSRCVVLLISRQPPVRLREGESSCRLSGMTADEAVQLFTQRLQSDDGTVECDIGTMLALSEKLDFIPASINAVARDINVKLVTPEDYLQALEEGHAESGSAVHLLGLETVFEELPEEGRALFPFLGVLRNVPWTADDLFAILLNASNVIEVGLAQLKRAGLVDDLEAGSFRTPLTISEYALSKLRDLGGQPLVEAAMALRSADILRKAELILRYARQSLLDECWKDESTRQKMMDSVARQFSGSVTTSIRKSENTNLMAVPLDPLQEFFEDVVLTEHPYVQQWVDVLQAAGFTLIRKQLEQVFDWAVEQEDWPLVRRFANRVRVNTAWIVDTELSGTADQKNWAQFGFTFALLKKLTANQVEVLDFDLKGSHVKSTSWTDCQFVAVEWYGVHVLSSTFTGIDMVGMVMSAGVVTGCTFADVDARFADLRGTIFQQCTFDNVNFRGASLEHAKFIDCYFNDVDFRLTVIEDAYSERQE